MDNTKHNQPAAAQDSDDLIAELARLVAQDARNNSGVQKHQEPRFAPEPSPAPVQDDFLRAERDYEAPRQPEPRFEPQASQQSSHQDDPIPVFDFGFGAPAQEPQAQPEASADPIAELIADAEVEAYDRDLENDGDWTEQAQDQGWSQQELPQQVEQAVFDDGRYHAVPAEHPSTFEPESHDSQGSRDPLSEIEALIGEAARANAGDSPLPAGRRVRSSFLDDTPTDAAVDAAESAILAAAAATGAPVRRSEPVQPISQPAPQPAREPTPQPVRSQPQPEPRFEAEPAFEQEAAFEPDPRIDDFERGPAEDDLSEPLFAAPRRDEAPRARAEDEELAFEDEDFEYAEERPRRKLLPFVVPVIAGTAILGLMGGAYFTFFAGPSDPGEAPILAANTEPLKQEAEVVPTQTTATESVVFNEIEGNTASPDEEELVSRDQTGGASGSAVAGVLASDGSTTELANRPVRTVTVRPDGTIVQADDSVAGSNVLPVDRPDVPPVPNSTLTADPIGEAIALAMAGEPTAGAAMSLQPAGAGSEEAPAQATPAETGAQTDAAEPVTAAADDVTVPRPIPRPAGLTGPSTAATTQVAAAPAQPIATPAASTPSTVGAWVQLSSQRTEEEARAGIPTLQNRYGALFNGATPEVSRVDLGERGIYYRVRLPQPTLAEANSVCGAIRGQGGDCFVMDN